MTIWVFCQEKWGGHSNDDFYTEWHTVYTDHEPTKEDTLKALVVVGIDDFDKFYGRGWHERIIAEKRVWWTKAEMLK